MKIHALKLFLKICAVTFFLVPGVLFGCFKNEPASIATAVIDKDSLQVSEVTRQEADTVKSLREKLIPILTISQDTLLEFIYGEEEFGEVKKVERSIGVYASDSGLCKGGGVVVIQRTTPQGTEMIDLAWIKYDESSGIWLPSVLDGFEIAFQTSKTIDVVERYSIAENCSVLQVIENINYGESIGSESILHFYTVDDHAIHGILSVVEAEQREGDDGDPSSSSVTLSEKVEVMTTAVNGFKDLEITQQRQSGDATEVETKLFKFSTKFSEYVEVDQ